MRFKPGLLISVLAIFSLSLLSGELDNLMKPKN